MKIRAAYLVVCILLSMLVFPSQSSAATCRQVATALESWDRNVLLKGESWPISKAGIDVQIKKYKAVLSNPSCVSTTTAKDYEEAVDFMLDACKKSSTNYALMKSTYRSNFSYICGKWKREFS